MNEQQAEQAADSLAQLDVLAGFTQTARYYFSENWGLIVFGTCLFAGLASLFCFSQGWVSPPSFWGKDKEEDKEEDKKEDKD